MTVLLQTTFWNASFVNIEISPKFASKGLTNNYTVLFRVMAWLMGSKPIPEEMLNKMPGQFSVGRPLWADNAKQMYACFAASIHVSIFSFSERK